MIFFEVTERLRESWKSLGEVSVYLITVTRNVIAIILDPTSVDQRTVKKSKGKWVRVRPCY
jgi:hypothetical protein